MPAAILKGRRVVIPSGSHNRVKMKKKDPLMWHGKQMHSTQ
jgi:hypothetical protein